ncbi:heparinase II/III family protein [Pseudidiomarina sp. 1APR75-15]|uniref:Heparinase II/III family protein n=2 Tax=Pseudidiomarina terrestris TaxID=2820060 RepID=A0ABT8MHF6_9GAMM|nr:heparinase II/III family protein [Pseudidiomarina sp. 1APR75-15]
MTNEMMKRIFCIVFILAYLSGCGGSEEQRPEPPPSLVTAADMFEESWVETLELDVLSNDQVDDFVRLEVVEGPKSGSIQVTSRTLTYTAPEQEVDEEFSYRVVTANATSDPTRVTIQLHNGFKSARLAKEHLVEGSGYAVTLELLLPLQESMVKVLVQRTSGEREELATLSGNTNERIVNWTYTPSDNNATPNYLIPSSEKLVFVLNGEELTLDYVYSNTPEPNELYNTIRSIWYQEGRADDVVNEREFLLNWTSFPGWTIPLNPDWSEDPFNNNTWLLYYHSLAWLHAYEYYYAQTGEQQYRDEIKRLILDYLAKSPRHNPVNYMSWNDHSVAVRVDVISYFYQQFLKNELTTEESAWVQANLEDHAAELRYLLDLDAYYSHNHSMFHSVSLLNLVLIMPDVFAETDYAAAARERIETLFTSMVVPETGFSREQSTGYHFVAMELFISASQFLQRIQNSNTDTSLERLNRMVDAAAHLLYRNGGAPAMGDTNFGVKSFLRRLNTIIANGNLDSEYFDRASGTVNTESLERAYIEETEGVVILRPNSSTGVSIEQYALVDFGLPKISHGHHDAGHVTYALNGHEIFVDAGGPYLYQGRERVFFDSKLSHNVPIINGLIRVENEAEVIEAACIASGCYTFGELAETQYVHRRLVFAPESETVELYVFDLIKTIGAEANDEIQLNWHLAPDVSNSSCIAGDSGLDSCEFTHPELDTFSLIIQSSLAATRTLYKGFDDGDYQQGWVQPKFGTRTPAPTLNYRFKGSEVEILTALQTAGGPASYERLIDGYKITAGNHEIIITSPYSESPMFEVRLLN